MPAGFSITELQIKWKRKLAKCCKNLLLYDDIALLWFQNLPMGLIFNSVHKVLQTSKQTHISLCVLSRYVISQRVLDVAVTTPQQVNIIIQHLIETDQPHRALFT